jgi:DNA polymerase-3 subunit gamma/tau
MSYLVLARKYRPKTFSELVGQSHVVQALSNALTQQRLHHAYLFTGTRGVGKTTVSRILAKSLNCERGITAEPCGACEICLAIDSGRFVDYTELDAASNRGVEEVQQLLEQAVYKPVQGRFKVFMIDEVHMLTNTAFNAMLKTLEEPPEYLKFVLATTDPQKVPVTVLSRCLQFNLRPMAPQTIVEHLSTVLTQEQLSFEPSALSLVSRAAKGSMRDALSLTDQAIAFGGGALVESEVRSMLGNVGQEHVFNLISALAQGSGEQVIGICNQLQDLGLSAVMALEDMAYALQRMACVQFGANTPTTESADLGLDPDHDKLQALAHSMPKDETQLLYNICIRGRSEIPLAPDEYSGLMMVLLRLLAFKDSPKDGSQDSAQQEHLAQAEKKL